MNLQQLLWKLFCLWLQGYGKVKIIYTDQGEVNHADLVSVQSGLLDDVLIETIGLQSDETVLQLHWD